jgi:hypothetical protein
VKTSAATSQLPTATVNGVIRTANLIYFFGVFDNDIAGGTAPNTNPITALGNVLQQPATSAGVMLIVGLSFDRAPFCKILRGWRKA